MTEKILIHAVGANTGGGLRHLNSLVNALSETDISREYDIYIRESLPVDFKHENIHIHRIPDNMASGWIHRIIFDVISIPRIANKNGHSCVVSLMNFGPILLKCQHIIYQCNVLYYSDQGFSLAPIKSKFEIIFRRFLASLSMRFSQKIITPSNSTKDHIRAKYPKLQPDRFAIIPHGFDSKLSGESLSKNLSELIHSGSGYKFFYPANLLRHKAFDILLATARLLAGKIDFSLFLTIDRRENPNYYDEILSKISKYHLKDKIIIIGNIPQLQMGEAYKLFDLMVYPSLVESFGMPLVEAMAYNCPIVASDTMINRETCGNSALFYSAENPEDAATKIIMALQTDVRLQLIERGKKRLATQGWSWIDNAKALIKVIEEVA